MPKSVKMLLPGVILVSLLVCFVRGDCPTGDLDRNCKVDFKDVGLFADQWLGDANNPADFGGGDGVNSFDFSLLAENWGARGASLVLSEFMASNDDTLDDEDGETSDWIEIHNPTSKPINLGGWYLTDNANNLDKWEFPTVEIEADGYKTVFASGKNRRDPDSELHTNFELRAGGEFLALVYPDGETIAHDYNEYPPEYADISYGLSDKAGLSIDTVLVPEYAPAKALVPSDGTLGVGWTQVQFDDSLWKSGATGVGYDTARDYNYLINLNVIEMRGNTETAYIRVPFTITKLENFDALTLYMKRDDGFAAYLNGVLLREASALANVDNLSWNSGSTANCTEADAYVFEPHDITKYRNLLRNGDNVLAIHGLNWQTSSSDMLILPKLVAGKFETIDGNAMLEGFFMAPSPGAANGGAMRNIGPAIYNVTADPSQPLDDDDLKITVEIRQTVETVKSVTLHYRVMYGSETTVAMHDDGAHDDGEATDGVYGATIPADVSSPGQMVRWYVTSDDIQDQVSRSPLFPYADNSPQYYGTVIHNPGLTSQLPILHWFVQNAPAADTRGGTRASVYYLGEFYDNVFVRIRGGTSAWLEKKNHKFIFNEGYHFRFAPDQVRVQEANINAGYADTSYMREKLSQDLLRDSGVPSCYTYHMRVQQNGAFHSLGIFVEQVDRRFLERHGLKADGPLYKAALNQTLFDNAYDFELKNNSDYVPMVDLVSGLNLSGTALRDYIFDNLNIPEVISYLATSVIVGETDHGHKNYYMHLDEHKGEWYVFPWDRDLSWGNVWQGTYIVTNTSVLYGSNNRLFRAIYNTPQARTMFLRRLRTLMDELLEPAAVPVPERKLESRIGSLQSVIRTEANLDRARWGFTNNSSYRGFPQVSFDEGVALLTDTYMPARRDFLYVANSVNNGGIIPYAQPDSFTIIIGAVDSNPVSHNQDEEYIQLVNPNPFAADISGWRIQRAVEHTFLPGTVMPPGESMYISPDVSAFKKRVVSPTGGQGRFVQGNYRGHLSSWGETIELVNKQGVTVNSQRYRSTPSDQQRYLRIAEIMYHPGHSGPYNEEEYEYIELENIGTGALRLDEVKLTSGVYYEFAAGADLYLGAGEHILILKNRDAFASRYDTVGMNIAPETYTGSLSNAGEKINLEDWTSSTILEFRYDDDWYYNTDGEGFSLTIRDVNNPDLDSWDEKNSWRASVYVGGSPGQDDNSITPDPGAVVINEVLAHSHDTRPDWIELYNTTETTIDIGGWYLSDSGSVLKKYRIAGGTTLKANEYSVLSEDANFGPDSPDAGRLVGFRLSKNGESVYLSAAEDGVLLGYRDVEDFGASPRGVSFGRYFKSSTGNFNFVLMDHTTKGSANAYPKVGPIVINEIMYNPESGNQSEEYIELYNMGPEEVTLYDSHASEPWKFTDGIDYTFPSGPGVAIPAGGYLLVARDVTAYMARYGLPPLGVSVLGPYNGSLDNGGEKLELSVPGDENVSGTRYYIRADRVNYSDGSHAQNEPGGVDLWPTAADGGGASLGRIAPERYGNDPNNWQATGPTPGQ
ncbi:MAG: lamin tail domain-containing protein [Phycisphaerales bacterium]|nr:MAG: lamin tail domain-containing protein [Phycisphaerales bacterium]